jgi:hypothetical protein
MGMCAVRGPFVTSSGAAEEIDGDATPRSTASDSSYVSGSSQELDADQYDHQAGAALWQRTIPRGRRCRPLSFSGVIVYDASGHQLETCREGQESELG